MNLKKRCGNSILILLIYSTSAPTKQRDESIREEDIANQIEGRFTLQISWKEEDFGDLWVRKISKFYLETCEKKT